MEHYVRILTAIWTIVVAASLIWSIVQIKKATRDDARVHAHINYAKDVLYRQWNAGHGGVYVPVTEKTPPNPYLSHIPERDITTPSGKRLTLMNPAYMTRQVYGLMEEADGVKGHITSLKPIRPENAPDTWEREALRAFEQGTAETSSISQIEGKTYYREMYPFIAEQPCLKCHAKQGYRVGDVRGGLSISVPMEQLLAVERRNIVTFILAHGLLWVLGLGGINYSMTRIRSSEEERKEADKSLRASEMNYRVVAENTYDCEFWLSPKGNYIYISPSCKRITGYSREEFLADPEFLYRIIHPEDAAIYERHRHEAEEMKQGEVQFRIIRRDGVSRWIEHNCHPVFDGEGKFLGIRGNNRDITDRRQAEDEIKHLAFFTASIINSLPGIFYLIDEHSRIIRWNEHFVTVTGYSAEEFSKMSPLNFFGEDERQLIAEKLEEVFTKGQSIAEAKLLSKDGKKTPYFFRGERILLNDKKYLIGMGIDITERKQAEEALRRATEELMRSNADLIQLTYVASHDLQEPLRMTASCVQLLAKRYKGKLDENADDLIEHVVNGAKRMQEQIRDVIDYLQTETGGGAFRAVDLSKVVDEVTGSLKEAIDDSGAVVTHDQLPTIMADFGQMSSLFENLIGNAIKFRGEEPPKVHISAKRRENEWIFSVQDNGIGIDREFAEKIFDVFKRLHTKEEFPGTGIGLAICRKILGRHGGKIWVDSEQGKGSTFYFTVPDKEASA